MVVARLCLRVVHGRGGYAADEREASCRSSEGELHGGEGVSDEVVCEEKE